MMFTLSEVKGDIAYIDLRMYVCRYVIVDAAMLYIENGKQLGPMYMA